MTVTPAFTIIIPARYASSRFPAKPLAPLTGSTGVAKSLVERSWDCARGITGASAVYIATDDARIAAAVRAFGGEVVMTSPDCRNGTERCAEAVATLGLDGSDIVVNLQGDAPLTPGFVVPAIAAALADESGTAMATVALRTTASTYSHLVGDAAAGRVGGTTVVTTGAGRALYFSKRVLPYVPPAMAAAHEHVRLHLGVYAYRADALARYATMPPSPLEELEGLEQLRFLEHDQPIRVVTFGPVGWDCIELNNPSDVPAIEAVLIARGIA